MDRILATQLMPSESAVVWVGRTDPALRFRAFGHAESRRAKPHEVIASRAIAVRSDSETSLSPISLEREMGN